MAAFTQLAAPVDITPTDDGTYKEIDVTAHVTNASGVLFRIRKQAGTAVDFFARKKGSTDNLTFDCVLDKHQYFAVGIDANDIFELKLETSGGVWEVDLIGYFDADDFVFFDNVVTNTPADATWSDFDISTYTGADTAIAAVCWATNDSGIPRGIGFRKKGSTDNRINSVGGTSAFPSFNGSPIIGCDGSEVFQVYREASFVGDFYCIGYAKSGVTMYTNALDASVTTAATWDNLGQSCDEGAFLELANSVTANEIWGVRPDGDTDYTFIEEMNGSHTWVTCGAVSTVVEANVQSTDIDIWLTGVVDSNAGGSFTLDIDGGVYTSTGGSVDLFLSRSLSVNGGNYSTAGANINLLFNRSINTDGGTYNTTGSPLDLLFNRQLLVDGGSYTYTGSAVTLVYNPLTGFVMDIDGGVYDMTGGQVDTLYNRVIDVDGGSYSTSGANLALLYNRSLNVDGGVYSTSGGEISLLLDRVMQADGGNYSYTGGAVGLIYSGQITLLIDCYSVEFKQDSVSISYAEDNTRVEYGCLQ